MPRYAIIVFLLGCLAGCAKPPELPEVTVRASTAGELTDFRTELRERFTADQLQPFDTALKELQLDAMERGVAPAAVREQVMLAAVNGKSVHDALIVGWKARRHRLLVQIELIGGMAEQNLKLQQETAATGTPDSVTTHLQNAREILVRLHRDLADTEHRLSDWGATPEPATLPKAN